MRHFYEMYVSANENWLQSSVMVNIRNSSKGKKTGKYVWKQWQKLAEECFSCKRIKPFRQSLEGYETP